MFNREDREIYNKIKRELPDSTLRRQIQIQNDHVTRMAKRHEPGTVKAYNELIKLAKLTYSKRELKPIEDALKKYKSTHQRTLW